MNAQAQDGQIGRLLAEIWRDLQTPDVLWQVAVLGLCWLAAWAFDRWLTGRFTGVATAGRMDLGRRGLKRIGLPLAMLACVLAARPILAQWQSVNLLTLAVPLLIAMVLVRTTMFVVRQSFLSRAPWLASFERVLAFLAWSIVAIYLLGVLPELIALLESTRFSFGQAQLNLWMLLQGAGALLATVLIALWIGGMVEARLMGTAGIDDNLRVLLSRLARALLVLLAILIGLPLVGIDLTALSVFGGALGVGLGFGLQKIAANYVSGFIILLDRSIRIGNMIAIGNHRGAVSSITTRYTVLHGLTGVEMLVPNEMLIGSVIVNETYTDSKVSVSIPVQVASTTDLEQAMRIMIEAARAQPRVLADPPPNVFLVSFADAAINLELGFWIADPELGLLKLRSDIQMQIWREFQAAGIELAGPQQAVPQQAVRETRPAPPPLPAP